MIDFVVLPAQFLILELNPFNASTGAGPFDWIDDAAVLHGSGPTQLRYNEKHVVEQLVAKGELSATWMGIIFDEDVMLPQGQPVKLKLEPEPESQADGLASSCTLSEGV